MARDREARMPVPKLRNYVDGGWTEPGGRDALDVENPSTGATIARVPLSPAADLEAGAAAGIDGEVLRLPIGVFAAIAPFNFPAMVPFWFIPYAIASGNTFVVKPSELVPCTMQMLTGLLDRCGLPKGVFNLVNGDRTV